MEIYFFKSVPAAYRQGFKKHYTFQNLKAVQVASLIFFLLNATLRLLHFILPQALTRAYNYPEFNVSNWIYLLVTPIFYLLSKRQLYLCKKYRKVARGSTTLILIFSIYLIMAGIMSGFIAMYSLSNLTLYLVALITIGIMCVFEYDDTLMLTLLTEILFSIILFYCQADPTEIIYSQLTSIILISGFYLISRYVYSYRASHYMQLIEIRLKNTEIEKASSFKNDVLGMVAHDLRNPIAAIESITMMMQLDEIDEETEDNLNMIKASCIKARSIINDLLEVARNDNSNILETDLVELNQLLQRLVNEWKGQQNIKNNIILLLPQKQLYAYINTEKFHRVLDNLISNAVKFSKEKDKIEVILRQVPDQLIIEVRDYGLGIPPEMVPHIFDRFSKAGRKGVRGESSVGLGLSIVKQIIEKHKGQIEVESEVGEGSTFRIYLPPAKVIESAQIITTRPTIATDKTFH